MEPNLDIVDIIIRDRQETIRKDVHIANDAAHGPVATSRRVSGRFLISIGEHLRGSNHDRETGPSSPAARLYLDTHPHLVR
jgi:hypothetical protein